MSKKKKCKTKKTDGNTATLSPHFHYRMREGLLLLTVTASLFLLLSLFTYHHSDPGWSHFVATQHIANSAGRVGAWIADFSLYLFGYLAYLFPVAISYAAWLYYYNRHRQQENRALIISLLILRMLGFLLILLAGCGFLNLHLTFAKNTLPLNSGGILGNIISAATLTAFNSLGASLILAAVILIGVTLFSGVSWFRLTEMLGSGFIRFSQHISQWIANRDWGDYLAALRTRRAEQKEQKQKQKPSRPVIIKTQPKPIIPKLKK